LGEADPTLVPTPPRRQPTRCNRPMSQKQLDISSDQRQLLQLVYDAFRQTGAWPGYLYVEQQLDQRAGADLFDVGRSIRGQLIQFDPHRSAASEVFLPIAGIACCDASEEDLRVFIAVLRWLITCQQDWKPSSPRDIRVPEVTSLEARAALQREGITLDEAALARAGALARLEGLFDPCSHQPERPWEWSGTPARSLRALRSATTIERYLSIRQAKDGWGQPAVEPPAADLPAVTPAPLATTGPAGTPGRPYIFILMPFDEEWSGLVRDAINRSCTELAAEGLQTECERADEIAKPGRITEQIIAAIHRADLIIADATGNNPNVMFELGFADALRKPIIVLNQDVVAAPFDIKDWRAIPYSVKQLTAAEEELRRVVVSTLPVDLTTRVRR
jgi:hypothetical protein